MKKRIHDFVKRRLPFLAVCWIVFNAAQAKTHDESFSRDGLLKADVNPLTDTRLLAHPDQPLDPKLNTLWCGTLQLAWNEAMELVGEKLNLVTSNGSALPAVTQTEIDLLNRQIFQRDDLDPSSYVALADFEHNHVEQEIRAALEKTFQGEASPELIPPTPPHPGPDDFVAYAYLYKNLAFAIPFGEIPALHFDEKDVEAFGLNQDMHLKTAPEGQVLIYDYKSPDDFVIELKSKSTDDQLILAKVAPGATLGATSAAVLKRMKLGPPLGTGPEDDLAVPKLNFDLRKDFMELEGLVLKPTASTKIQNQLKVAKVQQLIRFQLNEKGAVLKSEATIVMKALAIMMHHRLVFDRPFLLLMKQKNAKLPYLELWIANTTLLITSTRAPGT